MKIKAILIDVYSSSVKEIECENTFEGANGMYEHLKCDTIETVRAFDSNNILLVDEEANLVPKTDRYFMIDDRIYRGNGLVTGINFIKGQCTSCTLDIDKLSQKVTF
jgi:hypothetical protein